MRAASTPCMPGRPGSRSSSASPRPSSARSTLSASCSCSGSSRRRSTPRRSPRVPATPPRSPLPTRRRASNSPTAPRTETGSLRSFSPTTSSSPISSNTRSIPMWPRRCRVMAVISGRNTSIGRKSIRCMCRRRSSRSPTNIRPASRSSSITASARASLQAARLPCRRSPRKPCRPISTSSRMTPIRWSGATTRWCRRRCRARPGSCSSRTASPSTAASRRARSTRRC